MNNLLKLGVLVAAGVGTYELLRRAGFLEKATDWLDENIPQDLKDRAMELRDRARSHAEDLANSAQEAVRRATSQEGQGGDGARPVGNGASMGLTGSAHQGVPVTTDDYTGLSGSHKVGRGVI